MTSHCAASSSSSLRSFCSLSANTVFPGTASCCSPLRTGVQSPSDAIGAVSFNTVIQRPSSQADQWWEIPALNSGLELSSAVTCSSCLGPEQSHIDGAHTSFPTFVCHRGKHQGWLMKRCMKCVTNLLGWHGSWIRFETILNSHTNYTSKLS